MLYAIHIDDKNEIIIEILNIFSLPYLSQKFHSIMDNIIHNVVDMAFARAHEDKLISS